MMSQAERRTLRAALVYTSVFAAVFVTAPQANTQSEIVRKVEPEWGPELQTAYYVDVALVHIRVDRHGQPFSLDTETPLPENVVDALSDWRFSNASPVGYTVRISVRRALDAASMRALHRFWRPARFKDAVEAGLNAAPPRASDLSHNLPIEDQEQDIATQLVRYARHRSSLAPDTPRKRADLIAYLVENAPDSELLSSPLATLNSSGEILGDTPPRDYIRNLWLEHSKRSLRPDSKMVFSIANFLELSDPEIVEGLLDNSKLTAASIWLGDLWARAALGVSAVDPLTGRASATASTNAAFSDHARSSLQTTSDSRVLASALWALTGDARALSASGRLPDGYAPLCEGLLARWKTAAPQTTLSCDTAKQADDDLAGAFIKGSLKLPHLVHKREPVYPEGARRDHLSGTVKVRMIVGPDGRPDRLELLSGPILLVQPALDAMWTWVFEPATVEGRPVAYPAVVESNFKIR